MKMAPRSAVRKDKADFSTGLLIGKKHSYYTDNKCNLSIKVIFQNLSSILMTLRLDAGITEEQETTQMRKEQYRQELLRQIAEKQRKKMEYVFILKIIIFIRVL